jgi:hypothetical protein
LRAKLDEACEREGRDPASLPLSLMDPATEASAERMQELEDAGVTRVMLQHLDHEDLDRVEWIGRELAA